MVCVILLLLYEKKMRRMAPKTTTAANFKQFTVCVCICFNIYCNFLLGLWKKTIVFNSHHFLPFGACKIKTTPSFRLIYNNQ